jgi:hypothetical protein
MRRDRAAAGARGRVTTLVVVSTAFAARTEGVCRQSVANQTFKAEHRYIDASLQREPKTATENLLDAVADLPADTVVVNVDGDDWLAHPRVLNTIALAYFDHPDLWLTWGSYRTSRGDRGISAPYEPGENPRHTLWRMSHLKTFRAGLVRAINPDDLRLADGRFTHRAVDCAFMFPMYEMAGPERCRFLEEVLYTYHYDGSFEASASPGERTEERSIARYFRAKQPYARLESL